MQERRISKLLKVKLDKHKHEREDEHEKLTRASINSVTNCSRAFLAGRLSQEGVGGVLGDNECVGGKRVRVSM